MQALCKALVYALGHIGSDAAGDLDADVKLQEEVAYVLQSASAGEVAALRAAAEAAGYPTLLEEFGLDDHWRHEIIR